MSEELRPKLLTPRKVCGTCRFRDNGRCHRRAPGIIDASWIAANGNRVFDAITEWPAVSPDDWCGEWEIIDEGQRFGPGT